MSRKSGSPFEPGKWLWISLLLYDKEMKKMTENNSKLACGLRSEIICPSSDLRTNNPTVFVLFN